jgi:hypothetical protein
VVCVLSPPPLKSTSATKLASPPLESLSAGPPQAIAMNSEKAGHVVAAEYAEGDVVPTVSYDSTS